MKYVVITALLMLTGCTADKIFNEPEAFDRQPEIHFLTSTGTRAESENLEPGAKVRIYPYRQKTGITAPAVTPKEYTVSGNQLVPVGEGEAGKAMILPSGTFKFYAVSTNSPSRDVPVFDARASNGMPPLNGAGQAGSSANTSLANGVDYLHVMAEKTIQFGTASTDVPLVFKHMGTQVQLTIKFGENAGAADAGAAADFALAEVWVQQTDTADSYMRLNSGEIRFNNTTAAPPLPCNETTTADGKATLANTDKMVKMTVTKQNDYTAGSTIPASQVATYNMLPLQSGSSQKLWVRVIVQNIYIGGEQYATHTYTGKLDAGAGWKPGESNRYTLTLSGSEITFSGVTVKPWVTGSSGGEVGDVTDN